MIRKKKCETGSLCLLRMENLFSWQSIFSCNPVLLVIKIASIASGFRGRYLDKLDLNRAVSASWRAHLRDPDLFPFLALGNFSWSTCSWRSHFVCGTHSRRPRARKRRNAAIFTVQNSLALTWALIVTAAHNQLHFTREQMRWRTAQSHTKSPYSNVKRTSLQRTLPKLTAAPVTLERKTTALNRACLLVPLRITYISRQHQRKEKQKYPCILPKLQPRQFISHLHRNGLTSYATRLQKHYFYCFSHQCHSLVLIYCEFQVSLPPCVHCCQGHYAHLNLRITCSSTLVPTFSVFLCSFIITILTTPTAGQRPFPCFAN